MDSSWETWQKPFRSNSSLAVGIGSRVEGLGLESLGLGFRVWDASGFSEMEFRASGFRLTVLEVAASNERIDCCIFCARTLNSE